MLESRRHHSLDVPAALAVRDALPGRRGSGLLAVTHTGTGTWFPAYDGNVTGYVDETGAAAAYRYDPYGLLVSATGPEKDRFRHRFSTKPQDKERGLLHDGCGSLGTTIGKWIDRDPIEEEGVANLFGFVGNDGISQVGYLGFEESVHGFHVEQVAEGVKVKLELADDLQPARDSGRKIGPRALQATNEAVGIGGYAGGACDFSKDLPERRSAFSSMLTHRSGGRGMNKHFAEECALDWADCLQ